jgi:hypothetical protein
MTLLRVLPGVGATLAALALTLTGCREEPVRTYRVAKETPPPAAPATQPSTGELPPGHPPLGGMPAATPPSGDAASSLPPGHPPIGGGAMPALPGPAAATAATSTDSLSWAAPDHWVAKPLGTMRRGSFVAKNAAGEADCSIFVFPASSNPLRANIDRWRGQIGLPKLTDAQLASETAILESGELKFTVVDLLGQQPGATSATRVLGAILYRGEEAWFFKLGGPDVVVAAEKPAFLDFLRTVRPVAP